MPERERRPRPADRRIDEAALEALVVDARHNADQFGPAAIAVTRRRVQGDAASERYVATTTSTRLSENVGAFPRSAKAGELAAFTVLADRPSLRQNPSGATTTPALTASLTCATAWNEPRSLKTRTSVASPMLRFAASSG